MKPWLFFCCLLLSFTPPSFAKVNVDRVEQKIQSIAERNHCKVGVTAVHIETNKAISLNGNTPFFMASTIKLPIAIALLKRVDQGQEHLQRMVVFDQNDAVPGSGNLYMELSSSPCTHQKPLTELLRLMMQRSDNTASDLILREVKGPQAVSKNLQSLGFNHISVDRSIYDIYISSSGLSNFSSKMHRLSNLNRALSKVLPEHKVQAWKRFELDPRDTATPNEMAALLVHLYEGDLLSPANTTLLLNIMKGCQTGRQRIRGLLPACTEVAHKTGTWTLYLDNFLKYPPTKQLNRYANDVGIITLPHHQGHIALAIYVKSKAKFDIGREHTIARISREIYDYFSHREDAGT